MRPFYLFFFYLEEKALHQPLYASEEEGCKGVCLWKRGGRGVKDGGFKDEDKGVGGGGTMSLTSFRFRGLGARSLAPCLRTVRTALIGTRITVVGYRQCLGSTYMIPELTDWHVQRK